MCSRKLNRGSHDRHFQNPRATYRGISIATDFMDHRPPYSILETNPAVPRVYGPEMLITVLTEPATFPILSQINPSRPSLHISFEIHFNIILSFVPLYFLWSLFCL